MVLAPASTASGYEQSRLVLDCGPGCPEAYDMVGPAGYGFVNYTTYGSTLKLQVGIRNASPNTSYTIYLTCGPTHDLACGFVALATVTTDAYGRASANQLLISNPVGGGVRTDHVDIGGADGSWVVAGGINYTLP
jgi:hypothetical protein